MLHVRAAAEHVFHVINGCAMWMCHVDVPCGCAMWMPVDTQSAALVGPAQQ